MGKSWDDSAGEAVKTKLEYIKFEFGTNKMRMVGDILPRYAYWKQLKTNSIPVECLAFDRDAERFLNAEKDWFKHHFPTKPDGSPQNCSWSYVIRVMDEKDGKPVIKLCGLKKKLFEQIQKLAKKDGYGDPTNVDTGWEIVFDKTKTGPLAYNVEYTLDQIDSKTRPLTAAEKELVAEMPGIDEVLPRQTAEQQKAFIETAWLDQGQSEETNVDQAAADALEKEDAPF